jgi:hypothetical protein
MVKFWRKHSINIVLYLDDGFGMTNTLEDCKQYSDFVKQSLLDAGFLINEDKSSFNPVRILEWLGITWDSSSFALSIPDRRIKFNDLLSSLEHILSVFPFFTARHLAQITGKSISLSPVFGNVTRLMTRYCYMFIETREEWDKLLLLNYSEEVKRELTFWQENVCKSNLRRLAPYSPFSVVIYSDASNVACGAYSVEIENKIFHKMWNAYEKDQSYTWREMRAIELALFSFKDKFKGTSLKWHTDNQNCLTILKSSSMKKHLQSIAFSIFTLCMQECIFIDMQWMPRSENTRADYLSKMIDHENWGVSDDFIAFIDNLWGKHTIDRFASSMNCKTDRFNSLFWNPGSDAVDAFTENWFGKYNWLVPLIYLVVRAIKHLVFLQRRGYPHFI